METNIGTSTYVLFEGIATATDLVATTASVPSMIVTVDSIVPISLSG